MTGLTPLSVGVFTSSTAMAVAIDRGHFTGVGLDVTVEEVPGSAAQMAGLAEGRLQVIHTSPDNVMRQRVEAGSDAFVFLVLDTGLPQHLVAPRSGGSWDSLRGAVVGVDDPLSGFTFVIQEILRRHGVDPEDVSLSALGSSRVRLDALRNGDIAACLLSSAMLAGLDVDPAGVLASVCVEMPWYPSVAVATRESFSRQHPAVIDAYARALVSAFGWSQDPENAEELRRIVATRQGVDLSEADRIVASEAAARTSVRLTAAEAEHNLALVADLRTRATGVAATGYADLAWMARLTG